MNTYGKLPGPRAIQRWMNKKREYRGHRLQYSYTPLCLHVRVAGGEHGGETRSFFFAPPPFTRLLEMAMIAHDFKRAFAVDFFLQSPQRLIHWFALF